MTPKFKVLTGFEFDEVPQHYAPCPFCGDEGDPHVVNSKNPPYYTVMCTECQAEGPKIDQDYYTNFLHDNYGDENMDTEVIGYVCKKAALELWNKRLNLH